jgi:hypothetical protein
MGRGFEQFSFINSKAQDVFVIFSASLNYRLADGSRLDVHQDACWCSRCNTFRVGERIPTIEEVRAELQKLANPSKEEIEIWQLIGKSIEAVVADTEARLAWRGQRTSPAKCLHCGSTELKPLPHDEEFPHPVTGERMRRVARGFCDAGPWESDFTVEGDLIGEGYG